MNKSKIEDIKIKLNTLNYKDNSKFSAASEYFYKLLLTKYNNYTFIDKLNDNLFLERVYACLITWRLNRGSNRIISFDNFKKNLLEQKNNLNKLSKYNLDKIKEPITINSSIGIIFKDLFNNIKIIQTKQKENNIPKYKDSKSVFVSISKLLHFILPNLVIPMDNQYTGRIISFTGDKTKQCIHFLEVMEFGRQILIKNNKLMVRFYKNNINTIYYTKPKLVDDIIMDYVGKYIIKK